MYHHMYGGGTDGDWADWLWMAPMMLLWLAVLAGVVYGAVRLALKHGQAAPPER